MLLSTDLVFAMTRNHNAFLRKNLHQTFTADAFSPANHTNAKHWGFFQRHATALHPATGKNAAGNVTITVKQNRRRIVKKGKKHNVKSAGWRVTQKTVPSKKVTGHKCSALAFRGVRLHQTAVRAARLAKGAK
jgi:hypothetical protein